MAKPPLKGPPFTTIPRATWGGHIQTKAVLFKNRPRKDPKNPGNKKKPIPDCLWLMTLGPKAVFPGTIH